MDKTCIGFGEYARVCKELVDKRVNPVWCPRCDKLRRAHITQCFETLASRPAFVPKEEQ